jgi:hypothetical protein
MEANQEMGAKLRHQPAHLIGERILSDKNGLLSALAPIGEDQPIDFAQGLELAETAVNQRRNIG